ncbi:glycoside hydrolase family 24 protein, partial [Helicobacter cinaedi]
YTTHTKLDYKPPLSLQFNGKELQILEWGEVKRDKLDSNIFDKGNNENKAYYRIYSKDYDVIDKQDIPKLFSSYSLTYDILDTEKYYQSNHLKEQDIIVSMKQDTSLPKGSYYLYTKDIEQSLKIQTDYLYRARGYKALNIYTIDTNNQYKISYHSNPLDNIPYPKGTTFIIAPNTPIPTHYTDKKVKICLKGSRTYKDFILNLKQKIDTLKTQGYEIDKVKLEVGYVSIEIARLKAFMYALRYGEGTLYDKGYKTLVGGDTFDDFSKHPNIYNKKLNSTAAGAYQILKKTWDNIKKYRDKYGIDDFSPKNQDKSCIILLHKIRDSLDLIMANKIDEAVRTRTDKPKKRLHYEWASLPESPYNQRTETMENFMKYYDKHLKEELQGISNLAISNGEIAEFLQLLRSDK